ncbi:hypothetical protein LTS10_002855 [Elasticomyces elasticus]|nr:hypothetical protein LTS10_002855 [Elasticomyces elasticus]
MSDRTRQLTEATGHVDSAPPLGKRGLDSANNVEATDDRPAKRPHTEPSCTLREHAKAQEEIKALRAQIDELQQFVEETGLVLKTPPSIRRHLDARPQAAIVFANAIKDQMRRARRELGFITDGDEYSRAVAPFVEDIRTLSQYPHENSNRIALGLLVSLGQDSYGDLDAKGGSGYGFRDSDLPADELFCSLAKKESLNDPGWEYYDYLEDLVEFSKNLTEYGIDTFFVESIALMRRWQQADAITRKSLDLRIEAGDI